MNNLNQLEKPIKIPARRLKQLQRQFKYNYDNLSRDIFYRLDNESRLNLLNDEFQLDKGHIDLDILHGRLFQKRIFEANKQYIYTADFLHLSDKTNYQAHIQHNVYRTIAASLLTDCSLEEKAIILSKSVKTASCSYLDVLEISYNRLINLQRYTNQLSL